MGGGRMDEEKCAAWAGVSMWCAAPCSVSETCSEIKQRGEQEARERGRTKGERGGTMCWLSTAAGCMAGRVPWVEVVGVTGPARSCVPCVESLETLEHPRTMVGARIPTAHSRTAVVRNS